MGGRGCGPAERESARGLLCSGIAAIVIEDRAGQLVVHDAVKKVCNEPLEGHVPPRRYRTQAHDQIVPDFDRHRRAVFTRASAFGPFRGHAGGN